MPASTEEERDGSANTEKLGERQSFLTVDTDVAYLARPDYNVGVTHGIYVKAMHTIVALLDTGAGVNFIDTALIPPEWRDSVRTVSLPRI